MEIKEKMGGMNRCQSRLSLESLASIEKRGWWVGVRDDDG